jgi:hypothetical protein
MEVLMAVPTLYSRRGGYDATAAVCDDHFPRRDVLALSTSARAGIVDW